MDKKIPYTLLAKYYTGECTADEKKEVDAWQNVKNENKKMFIHLEKIWNSKENQDVIFIPDYEKALHIVDEKIKPDNSNKIIWFVQRIAALLIISLCLWFAYYLYEDNSEITIIEIRTEKDEKREIILADGSKIWMNELSEFHYPETLDNESRKVFLNGEAYFEITKNKEKPFEIETHNSLTKVLGTSFNIQAIESNKSVVVTVEKGLVSFSSIIPGIDKNISEIKLKKGEKGVLVKLSNSLIKSSNNDLNYLSWKTGKIVFKNTPLSEVVTTLSEYYNISIQIYQDTLKSKKFTLTFDNKKLEDAMKILELTIPNVKIAQSKDEFVILSEKE